MNDHREATIVVADHRLTSAQSMAVRVAIAAFLSELASPQFMSALGRIGPLYQARLAEVQDFIFEEAK
jgi:hypothetical protein